LFRKANKNMSLRKVINLIEDKNRIIKSLHNKSDYKNRESIYRCIAN